MRCPLRHDATLIEFFLLDRFETTPIFDVAKLASFRWCLLAIFCAFGSYNILLNFRQGDLIASMKKNRPKCGSTHCLINAKQFLCKLVAWIGNSGDPEHRQRISDIARELKCFSRPRGQFCKTPFTRNSRKKFHLRIPVEILETTLLGWRHQDQLQIRFWGIRVTSLDEFSPIGSFF
jgi:hypothetical protein